MSYLVAGQCKAAAHYWAPVRRLWEVEPHTAQRVCLVQCIIKDLCPGFPPKMNLVLGLFRQQTGAGEFCYLTMINVSHEPDINGLIWWQPPARSPHSITSRRHHRLRGIGTPRYRYREYLKQLSHYTQLSVLGPERPKRPKHAQTQQAKAKN